MLFSWQPRGVWTRIPSEFAPPAEESSSAGALVAIVISPAVLKGLSELETVQFPLLIMVLADPFEKWESWH